MSWLEDGTEGTQYKVTFKDCCAEGSFEAVLTAMNYVTDPVDNEPFLESVTFGNGVTISGHGVELEPA